MSLVFLCTCRIFMDLCQSDGIFIVVVYCDSIALPTYIDVWDFSAVARTYAHTCVLHMYAQATASVRAKRVRTQKQPRCTPTAHAVLL